MRDSDGRDDGQGRWLEYGDHHVGNICWVRSQLRVSIGSQKPQPSAEGSHACRMLSDVWRTIELGTVGVGREGTFDRMSSLTHHTADSRVDSWWCGSAKQ